MDLQPPVHYGDTVWLLVDLGPDFVVRGHNRTLMGAGFPPLVNGGWVLKFFVCRSFPIISERCHQRGGGQAVRRRPGMGAAETRPYTTGTRFGSWRTRGRIIVFAVITGHIRTPGCLLPEDRRPVPSAVGWAMVRKHLFGYILWRIRRRERRRQGFAVVFVSVRGVAVLPHPVAGATRWPAPADRFAVWSRPCRRRRPARIWYACRNLSFGSPEPTLAGPGQANGRKATRLRRVRNLSLRCPA